MQCGTPGRPGVFSCHECGATVSEVRELAAVSSGPSPASWRTTAGGGAQMTYEYEAAPADAPHEPVKRSRVPVLVASLMVLVFIAVAAGAVATIVRTYHDNNKPGVPKDLRAWASGEGARTFATKSFSISMPVGYEKAPVTWATAGGTLDLNSARAAVSGTVMYVEAGAVTKNEASNILDVMDTVGAHVADVMRYSGFKVTGHEIKWYGARGVEVTVKTDKSTAIARIVVARSRIVVIAVASGKDDPEGAYVALLESYQPV